MVDRPYLAEVAARGPRPVFATISGAHLYGFASPDSDVDLRGAFQLPTRDLLGLGQPRETITITDQSRIDLDWVAHDLRKFVRMMVSHNGYALEQLFSPLVVVATPLYDELRALGQGCITRGTVRHYQGFARGRRLRLREPDPTVKHLLYAYRVYLAGIHVMQTGQIESNLAQLAAAHPDPIIDELVARKRAGAEHMALAADELELHERRLVALETRLADAHAASALPDEPTTLAALDELVLRARLADLAA